MAKERESKASEEEEEDPLGITEWGAHDYVEWLPQLGITELGPLGYVEWLPQPSYVE